MESYKVVDDNTHDVLLEVDETSGVNAWEYAYERIRQNPEMDIFIEVYEDGVFDHWCDSESIVYDCEIMKGMNEK